MDIGNKILLGKNLQDLLEKNRISQGALANKLNINKSTLHNYINGVIPQGLLFSVKVCDFFEVTLDELVFGPQHKSQILPVEVFGDQFEITIRTIAPNSKNKENLP